MDRWVSHKWWIVVLITVESDSYLKSPNFSTNLLDQAEPPFRGVEAKFDLLFFGGAFSFSLSFLLFFFWFFLFLFSFSFSFKVFWLSEI
jgi:hypothetical protein